MVFDVVSLVAIHGWPGWDVLPFLTSDTDRVVGLVIGAISGVAHLVQACRRPG